MKIFISGASGLLGSNCAKHFEQQGCTVVGSHLSFPLENTVYYNTLEDDKDNYDIIKFAPDVIVHCGALTNVDYCESHEEESYQKTVQSTQNLLNVAKSCGAKFVLISTDYVFDGEAGPYTEGQATNPLCVYGRHKLEAEQIVQSQYEQHLIIRITNVYGDEVRKKNFVARIESQIAAQQPLTLKLPIDQYATPTNAWDIARALYLLLHDDKKGIYHIASSDLMNRVTLALSVVNHYAYSDYELMPISTASLQQAALRPLLGGLISKRFNEEYPDFLFSTLRDYLSAQKK